MSALGRCSYRLRRVAPVLLLGAQWACGSPDAEFAPEQFGLPEQPASPSALPCEGIDSGYDGDSQCIQPPPSGEGMQLHYGPSAYDDPDEVERYLIAEGDESVDCVFRKTPNAGEV